MARLAYRLAYRARWHDPDDAIMLALEALWEGVCCLHTIDHLNRARVFDHST